ncbi:MAG TPA: acyl-CoA desaturase [Chryseolinea sp.]|nr:acyl-CoA desaturase [Chryseolinea sp.]
MSFKTAKLKFAVSENETFYDDLKKEVNAYLHAKRGTGGNLLIIKAVAYCACLFVSYIMLVQAENYIQLQIGYWALGFSSIGCALNFAHDAAHHALTGNKKLDDIIFEIVFNWQGANGYLWKIRHNHSHHVYPNVDDCDADLEVNGPIALSPNQRLRWYHKYQHIYAPFAYMFYTLLWLFYKDFRLFFSHKQANIVFAKHPTIEWIKLFAYKGMYLCVFILIPWQITGLAIQIMLLSFVVMHLLLSFFLLFTFLISHYVERVRFTDLAHDGRLECSWARHQVNVSVDFHAEELWASWLFGGFNTHVAHHLFPKVCHVHYPHITRMIRLKLSEHKIPYQSLNYFQGMASHLKLLKALGNRQQ